MARLSKEQNAVAKQFGFAVAEPPEIERTRAGKNDEMWEAAKTFCESLPNTFVKIYSYKSKQQAANDARNINNGGPGVGRFFHGNLETGSYQAVSRPAFNEDDEPIMVTNRNGVEVQQYDLYLKYNA